MWVNSQYTVFAFIQLEKVLCQDLRDQAIIISPTLESLYLSLLCQRKMSKSICSVFFGSIRV
jgi:hypothetical protein